MCNCGGGAKKQIKSLMSDIASGKIASPFPAEDTESVRVIAPQAGYYTADSGTRYRSWGIGTSWVIRVADRPSLEKMGLIAPKL